MFCIHCFLAFAIWMIRVASPLCSASTVSCSASAHLTVGACTNMWTLFYWADPILLCAASFLFQHQPSCPSTFHDSWVETPRFVGCHCPRSCHVLSLAFVASDLAFRSASHLHGSPAAVTRLRSPLDWRKNIGKKESTRTLLKKFLCFSSISLIKGDLRAISRILLTCNPISLTI
jgi:hypothetical protein